MKSKTNKTKYDDLLFYRCIPAALNTLFVVPLNAPFSIIKRLPDASNCEISAVKIQKTLCSTVNNGANGTVYAIIPRNDGTQTVLIKHLCGIYSRYDNIYDCDLVENTPINQGAPIGLTGKDGENKFSINFSIVLDTNEVFFGAQ